MKKLMGIFVAFVGVFALTPGVLAETATQEDWDAAGAVYDVLEEAINNNTSYTFLEEYKTLKDVKDEADNGSIVTAEEVQDITKKMTEAVSNFNKSKTAYDALVEAYDKAEAAVADDSVSDEEKAALQAFMDACNVSNIVWDYETIKSLNDQYNAIYAEDEPTTNGTTDNNTKDATKTTETKSVSNPSTADGILAFLGLAILSIGGIVIARKKLV